MDQETQQPLLSQSMWSVSLQRNEGQHRFEWRQHYSSNVTSFTIKLKLVKTYPANTKRCTYKCGSSASALVRGHVTGWDCNYRRTRANYVVYNIILVSKLEFLGPICCTCLHTPALSRIQWNPLSKDTPNALDFT